MPEIMRLAAGMARQAATRQAVIATNVANADTPGYRARDMATFSPDDGLALRRTHARHLTGPEGTARPRILHDVPADPNGNTVSLEDQVLRGIEAARHHDRALTVYRSALGMMRAGLGRG
ncbi:FlgB family protein [Jannaschia sp. S6380]|uniref:FlgB family protein n=1 Tax=Jannaschia sp. S6380 TaxID=2926408 RepID=UPI001FF65E59|nr:FlgB family protein [Jannaschia sp. S6380]MCK0168265.1 FlgB family protein [Jannaschia sp. S6380]